MALRVEQGKGGRDREIPSVEHSSRPCVSTRVHRFWAWALASALLGLGFTFFSGAVQAWLVDALTFTGYFDNGGQLETVLAKGEIVEGAAMLRGKRLTESEASCAHRSRMDSATRPSGGSMLEAPFTGGVMIYAFYAMQPNLLELYGNQRAFAIAGLESVRRCCRSTRCSHRQGRWPRSRSWAGRLTCGATRSPTSAAPRFRCCPFPASGSPAVTLRTPMLRMRARCRRVIEPVDAKLVLFILLRSLPCLAENEERSCTVQARRSFF